MRTRWILAPVAAYALTLSLIALWASPVDRGVKVVDLAPVAWMVQTFGLTAQQGYDFTQFTANIVLFVPLGIFAMVLRPHWRWWHVTAFSAAVSATIELLQELFRPHRFATFSDIIANTAGGAIGALACLAWITWSRRASKPAAYTSSVEFVRDNSDA